MDQMMSVYHVRIPMSGQPDGFHTICRCLRPDNAAEIARALLCGDDSEIGEVRIVRYTELMPVGSDR